MKLTNLNNVSLNVFFQILNKSINNRKLENVRSYIFIQRDKTIDINFDIVVLLDLRDDVVFFENFLLSIMLVSFQKKFFHEYFSIVFFVFRMRRQLFVSIVNIVFQILIDSNHDVIECNDMKIKNLKFSLFFNSIMNFDVIFFFENEKTFVIDINFNNDENRTRQRINWLLLNRRLRNETTKRTLFWRDQRIVFETLNKQIKIRRKCTMTMTIEKVV